MLTVRIKHQRSAHELQGLIQTRKTPMASIVRQKESRRGIGTGEPPKSYLEVGGLRQKMCAVDDGVALNLDILHVALDTNTEVAPHGLAVPGTARRRRRNRKSM